jgi:hypothetical protein
MTLNLNHSYFFIDTTKQKSIKLSECKTKLMDSNTIIMGLLHIPINTHLYKIQIIHGKYLFNNTKIQIELDTSKLNNYVLNNKKIPNKAELCFLLRKKFIHDYKEIELKKINLTKLNICNKQTYFKSNFIKLNNIIIDIINHKFYKESEIDKSVYSYDYDISIIYSYPNIKLLQKIISNTIHSTIIIYYNKTNLVLLNHYLKHIKKKKTIELVDFDSKHLNFNNNFKKDSLNTHILFDLSNNIKELFKFKTLITNNNKVIIINQKNRHILIEDYFNVFINHQYSENIKQFNKCITYLSNNTLVFSKKNFKPYHKTNKYINKLSSQFNKKELELYYSLPENIINYNYFTLTKYKTTNCSICLGKLKSKNTIATYCGHLYCESCLLTNLLVSNKCPQCREKIQLTKLFKANTKYSDKLNYLMKNIDHKQKLLVVSYYKESLKTISFIIKSNTSKNNAVNTDLNLIHIKQCLTIKDYSIYDKIILLENNYKDFDYYKYLLFEKKISKQKIEILI